MRRWYVVALALSLFAVAAAAQVQKGDWEFSPMAGYAFPGAELKSGPMGSFSVGYNFTKQWGLELQAAYADSKVWDLNRDMSALRLSVFFNFLPDHRTVPYLKVGIGGAGRDPDGFGDVFDGDKSLHLGGGLRRFVSPRVALRLEALASYTYDAKYGNTHAYELVKVRDRIPWPLPPKPALYRWNTIYPVKDSFMSYEVQVGLSFFPKKRRALPAPTPSPVAAAPAASTSPAPEPAPAPQPPRNVMAGAMPAPSPAMITVSLSEVISHFKVDKWDLPKDGVPLLDGVVARLQEVPALQVTITGHTDSTGPASWNDVLSRRRAEAVKKYLVDHGIAESRIVSVTGYAATQPIADNGTKEGRSKNRRAEVKSVAPVQVPAR
ncbi:MAG: OmpA family protein [Acidobacteriota bacterium]